MEKTKTTTILKKCCVCCHSFQVQDVDQHMHSFGHHKAIEKLKGSEQVHKCWACDWSVVGLQEYKKHISTAYHRYKMTILTEVRSDDNKSTVDYSDEVDDELKAICAQRDQQKRNKKKATKRKAIEKTKNMSQSVQAPKPAKASLLVKRPCPPSAISAHVSGEPTCAPEPVQREISTLLQSMSRDQISGQEASVASQEDLDSLQTISCKRKKEQDSSNTRNPETTCRQKANELMTLSSREEELADSLSNVGDQLFQAYTTLHTAYTEFQHLLIVQQQVTSEMSSLRAKRIQLLQDMIE